MTALDFGLLVVRLAVGLTFFAHGAQKVLGWWEGPGLAKWTAVIALQGLRPARFWGAVGALNEFISGPLLALGLLTPIAASLLVAQSVYIIARVHWAKGFWNRNSGIEFALQMLSGSVLLTLSGPGAISLDALLRLMVSSELRVAIFVIAIAGVLTAIAMAHVSTSKPDQPRAA
jgi:putative oxidoreductase